MAFRYLAPRSHRPTSLLFALVPLALATWGCDGMLSTRHPSVVDSSDGGVRPEDSPELKGGDAGMNSEEQGRSGEDSGRDNPEAGPEMGGGAELSVKPNQIEQSRFFACADPSAQAPSPSRLRRLNQLSWLRNTGRARLGSPAQENPLRHSVESPYSTYAAEDTLESALLSAYMDVVAEAAKPVVQGRYEERRGESYGDAWIYQEREALDIECMYDGTSRPDRACVERFTEVLLERGVFHRPASAEEIQDLSDFAERQLASERAGEREATLTRVVSGAWLMTGALFQSELGGQADAEGRRRLEPWEIAHAVGTALMTRRPGALPVRSTRNDEPYAGPRQGHMRDLYQAAEDGSIQDKAVLEALLRAHLTGVQLDERGEVTHIGGEDPERFDVRLETRTSYHRRGEYGLPEGVREFFVEYFDYANVLTDLKSDSSKTSKYWQIEGIHNPMYGAIVKGRNSLLKGENNEANHKEQLDDFIARVVAGDQEVLKGLLTDRTYWLMENDHAARRLKGANREFNRPAAERNVCQGYDSAEQCAQNEFEWFTKDLEYVNAPYGYDEVISKDGESRARRWVEMPEGERGGVLTHPTWLAAHGANFENDASAIYRGKWIVEHLLCGSIPDVPIAADAQLNPESVGESARFRIKEKTESNGYCLACHEVMNPLGYAFETYNHAGFVRVENHGEAQGSFGQAKFPTDVTFWKENYPQEPTWNYIPEALRGESVQGGMELSRALSESEQVRQCFVRHTFRYFMGRDEREQDACVLKAMDQSYEQNQGSFVEMLITLLTSDAFLYRADVPD